jgi:hypothetical protein
LCCFSLKPDLFVQSRHLCFYFKLHIGILVELKLVVV